MLDTINVYDATETRKGVSEIATQSEVTAGTDDFRYITPKKLKIVTDEIDNLLSTINTNYQEILKTISDLDARLTKMETNIDGGGA